MENNDGSSFIIVSDDHLSKKVKIYENTNFDNFYQEILNYFPQAHRYLRKLFYYEAYSHEKGIITNNEEFIIANKKCIEYFYFCPNYSEYDLTTDNEANADYLKYHSIILFSPIEIVNTEEQKNAKKKMKIIKNKIINSNNSNNESNISNNNIYNNNIYNNNLINNNNYCTNNNFNNPYMNPMMTNMNYNFSGLNNQMIYNNNNIGNTNLMNHNNMNINTNQMLYNRMNPVMNSINPMINSVNQVMNNNILNNINNPFGMSQMISNNIMNNMNQQRNSINQINPMRNSFPNYNNNNMNGIMNNNNMNSMMINNNMNGMNNNYNNNMNSMMAKNNMNGMINNYNNNMNSMMAKNNMNGMMNNNNMNSMMINNNMNVMNNNYNNNMNSMMAKNNMNGMINNYNNNMNSMMTNNNMNGMINNYNNNMNNNIIMNNKINNQIINSNINNQFNYYNNFYQPMNTPISQQTFQTFFTNLQNNNINQALLMMGQMNPVQLKNRLEEIIKRGKIQTTNNNIISNNNDDDYSNQILDFEILDTETNPMNKFIENAINISYTMKQQILKHKSTHPDMFIDIVKTLSTPGLLVDDKPSDEDYKYILCLIGKIIENNDITVGIYKQNIIKDRIDLCAIQFIFSGLINKKKYKILFNFTEEEILCIKHADFKKPLIDKWKTNISKKLKVKKNLLILTNLREEENKYYMDLAFNPEVNNINTTDEKYIREKLIGDQIQDCKMTPLLEGCRLSINIFAPDFNKVYSKNSNNNDNNNNNNNINNNNNNNEGKNKKRGNENYISPIGWSTYGINVSGKFDYGDNTWLGNNNQEGEYAVAYYGVNNLFHHNIQMIQNIISFMGNLESGKTFMDQVNLRKPGEKCMTGAYFYNNPEIAENSSEVINIGGFDYKIMFMCRVNSKKIRQPQNFPQLWILSPTPDEIRPYKILIKKIAKTSLANASQQNIKMTLYSPPPTYYQILQNKDESYFSKNTSGISNYDFVLKDYTGCLYSSVNNYLRDGAVTNNNNKDLNSTVWCLHKAITQNNSNVQNGVLLYRGVCKKLPSDIGIGTRFFFPEFISTSKDINVAKSFGGSGTLMYITVENNGTNGKKVYCRDVSSISNFPHEQEILFTSYCKFRVTKIEKSDGWDILHLTCEGHNF